MRSLFSGVKDTPGVCSPSRRVVSKTLIFSGKLLNKAIPHFPSHTSPKEKKPPTYKTYDFQILLSLLSWKFLNYSFVDSFRALATSQRIAVVLTFIIGILALISVIIITCLYSGIIAHSTDDQ